MALASSAAVAAFSGPGRRKRFRPPCFSTVPYRMEGLILLDPRQSFVRIRPVKQRIEFFLRSLRLAILR